MVFANNFAPDKSQCRNVSGQSIRHQKFYSLTWDTAHNQLFAVQIGSGSVATVYDIPSGAQIATYGSESDGEPVSVVLSPDGNSVLVYGNGSAVVWNRSSGVRRVISGGSFGSSRTLFSPDAYLITSNSVGLGVVAWDLQNINADGAPNFVYTNYGNNGIRFIDNVMIVDPMATHSTLQQVKSLEQAQTSSNLQHPLMV
ncbi:MAG: hypothetical protein U0694_27810 [Anaerolineae bacterium]